MTLADERVILPLKDGKGGVLPTLSPRNLLKVFRLEPDTYVIKVDGKEVYHATDEDLAAGVDVRLGPQGEQAEQLRRAILKKNELFFYRWRPQNQTYLFGFRRREQGQNGREIAEFDPLIAEQEKIIAELNKPVPHTFENRSWQ